MTEIEKVKQEIQMLQSKLSFLEEIEKHNAKTKMTEQQHLDSKYQLLQLPKYSNYKCYLFGNRPGGTGIVYTPQEGRVPNRFVRFMMRICFDSIWVNEK